MVPDVFVDNKADNAAWYYHHPHYGYNCAQAIVKHFGGSDEDISEMRKMGSGRAPDGQCGALYGALFMTGNNPEASKMIIEEFAQKAGSPFCRVIRKAGITSCRQCVEIANSILTEIQQTSDRQ